MYPFGNALLAGYSHPSATVYGCRWTGVAGWRVKKVLIVLAIVLGVLLLLEAMVVSWFEGKMDEVVLDMSAEDSLREVCEQDRNCLAAVDRYAAACASANGPTVVDSETFFEHLANVIECVTEREGSNPFPTG